MFVTPGGGMCDQTHDQRGLRAPSERWIAVMPVLCCLLCVAC